MGLWRGVLRVILGRRRDENGAFCRGIPGFLSGARGRHGDSAHGGRCRVLGAKKFLKIFKNRGGKPKNWGVRRVGRWHEGTLYRVCGVIFGSGNETSGSVAKGAVNVRDSLLLYIEDLFASSIAHLMEVSPLVRSVILQPSTVA